MPKPIVKLSWVRWRDEDAPDDQEYKVVELTIMMATQFGEDYYSRMMAFIYNGRHDKAYLLNTGSGFDGSGFPQLLEDGMYPTGRTLMLPDKPGADKQYYSHADEERVVFPCFSNGGNHRYEHSDDEYEYEDDSWQWDEDAD